MPDVAYESSRRSTLTCLLLPLSDRYLLLPNVAVAELIDYQDCHADPSAPAWYLGNIRWRDLDLPLLSFEAACGGRTKVGGRARIVVLNALGGNAERRYLALLIQNIPRSCKVDNQLSYVDVPLAPLEVAAVQVGDTLARVPNLVGLEQWLVDAGVAGPTSILT